MDLYSLGNLIIREGKEDVEKFLTTFQCNLNKDIENFLFEKAILYEQQNISRTFMIVDYIDDSLVLLAYYTIAMKEFQFDENLSRTKKKQYLGTTYEANKQVPALLIGQLGKNTAVPKAYQIKGIALMDCVMDTLASIRQQIGGRIMYVEAKQHTYLHTFYTSANFMPYIDQQGLPICNEHGLQMYMLPSPKYF